MFFLNPTHPTSVSFNNSRLEKAKYCWYLGIELSVNCSFKLAEKGMCDKASKALFQLNNTYLKPEVALNYSTS